MTDPRHPWLELRSQSLTAEIDPLGAQLSSLRDRSGRDLLWDGNAAFWTGRAPLLFPIVGVLVDGAYRLGGEIYRLPRHGFARGRMFSIDDVSPAAAQLTLRPDAATREVYPFHFGLSVRFEVDGPTLSMTAIIHNSGATDMPASFGYHPGFRWPLPYAQARSSHYLEFERDENSPVRRINSAGLLAPERHASPVEGRRLMLRDALFQDDVLIFDGLRSRSLTYGGDGGPRIRVDFPDAPYLGIWTKPGADFICIEPWHGITDLEGFSGDFRHKTGVFILSAGQTLRSVMAITLG